MKLALSSYAYNWAVGLPGYRPERPMTVFDLLDQAVRLGVHVVQVVDNIPFELQSGEEQERFIQRAGQLGIELEFGMRGIEGQHLEQGIRLAGRMHSKVLRVVVDKGNYRPSEEKIVQTIQGLVPLLEEHGVSLAIENTERFKAKKFAELAGLIGSKQVGICLDTANNYGIGEGIEAVVAALGPLTLDLHLKDYSIHRMSHRLGYILEGSPAGQGQLDIFWILETLRHFGRDPNVVLELWTPPDDNLEDTINKEKKWVDQSIEYLRKVIRD
ncbi:MAG: TIM barrel protein [Bryobacteraceae bacterium]|jgi:sugar phosphate isomerase/epimerase